MIGNIKCSACQSVDEFGQGTTTKDKCIVNNARTAHINTLFNIFLISSSIKGLSKNIFPVDNKCRDNVWMCPHAPCSVNQLWHTFTLRQSLAGWTSFFTCLRNLLHMYQPSCCLHSASQNLLCFLPAVLISLDVLSVFLFPLLLEQITCHYDEVQHIGYL